MTLRWIATYAMNLVGGGLRRCRARTAGKDKLSVKHLARAATQLNFGVKVFLREEVHCPDDTAPMAAARTLRIGASNQTEATRASIN